VSTRLRTADSVSFRARCATASLRAAIPNEDVAGVAIYEYNPETGGRWWTSSSDATVNVEREGFLIIVILEPKTGPCFMERHSFSQPEEPSHDSSTQANALRSSWD